MQKTISTLRAAVKPDFLFRNLLVPLALLALYCGVFALVAARFFPGVNAVFAGRMAKYLLVALGLLVGATLALFVSQRQRPMLRGARRVRWGDLVFVLLPLTTVTQYIVTNRASILPRDIVFTLGFFALFGVLFIVLLPAALEFTGSPRVLTATSLAFVVTLVNMAMLSQQFHWFSRGALKIQLLYFAGVWLLALLLAGIRDKKLLGLALAFYLIANTALQLLPQGDKSASVVPTGENAARFSTLIGARKPASTRNVYLLVYDAYVADETMRAYSIDNHDQETFLQSQGFVLYPHTYSIGASTLSSMSLVWNVSIIQGIAAETATKQVVSGQGLIHSIFRQLGYTTYGVFATDYLFRGVGSSYDFSIPARESGPSGLLIGAVLMGEFRFNLGFDDQSHEAYLLKKLQIFENPGRAPRLLYAHSSRPSHSQNSGACLKNEFELYSERLAVANAEMRQDVAALVTHDPQAIIIIAGDHGPYLTKNCVRTGGDYPAAQIERLDIQDRYGSFLAIRWPTDDYATYDQITVLQDVFPAVLAYLYRDPAFLELKLAPETLDPDVTSGVVVKNGVISGGVDDGEPLFLSSQ